MTDERKLARQAAILLPVLTVIASLVGGAVSGIATGILVLVAGTLLGVIALFWASLRVLSGEVEIPHAIALDRKEGHDVDALVSRKTMLVRALKDLDNEHALGKLEDDDYAELSQTYRGELKALLRKIDDTLEPFRAQAEEAARSYLAGKGSKAHARVEATSETSDEASKGSGTESEESSPSSRERRECSTCHASNEADARFCKGCAAPLEPSPAKPQDDVEAPTP